MNSEYIFETTTTPAHQLYDKFLTDINFKVFEEVGLPDWVAPHLYFGPFDEVYLPKINDWTWIDDWKNSNIISGTKHEVFHVIGSSQDHAPIFLKPNDSQIYTFEEDGINEIIINSSLTTLLFTLNEYALLIESAMETYTSNVSKIVEKEAMEIFISSFHKSEILKLAELPFWKTAIAEWEIVG
jgi:hypothetical protein